MIRLKFMNWAKIQVSLVMILSLVLIPVSGSNASNMLQSDAHIQTIEMSHSVKLQHEDQQNLSIHDSEEIVESNSHTHDGMSPDDCCSLNCSAAIVADARSKIIVNPSESYILPAHRLLLPSGWDTQLRPPKT
ncbi:MAG: hypothetical protein JKY83_03310 [Rhizobiaceae bacterium]|nr:hypothetical protein [Rhizobiaceae bacterium]